jgi:hypothetical protein
MGRIWRIAARPAGDEQRSPGRTGIAEVSVRKVAPLLVHSLFHARSPDQMLDTAAPWTSPWLPPGYEQNFWNAA